MKNFSVLLEQRLLYETHLPGIIVHSYTILSVPKIYPFTTTARRAAPPVSHAATDDSNPARQRSRRPPRGRQGTTPRPGRGSNCCCSSLARQTINLLNPQSTTARPAGSSHHAATDGDEPGRPLPRSPTLACVNGRRPVAVPLSLLRLRTHSPVDPARPPRRSSTTTT